MNTFGRVNFDAELKGKQYDCQVAFENVEDILVKNFQKMNRELAIAMTKLEEAHMWVNKAIRTEQIERDIRSLEEQG